MELSNHISNVRLGQLVASFKNFIKETFISFKTEESCDIPFILYFMRRLRAEHGIRYRPQGNNIVLFTYDKRHPKYDKNNDIVQLCRHMMMDLNNFRIIQLGIIKSSEIENAFAFSPIECVVEDLVDGTMVIYNPSLKSNNVTIHTDDDNIGGEETLEETVEETTDTASSTINDTISTRGKVGTSTFNSRVTFKDQFELHNRSNNIHLENIPGWMQNLCYVFNTTTQGEHIAQFNCNLLVGVFGFKPKTECDATWNNIIENYMSKTLEELDTWLDDVLTSHFTYMLRSYNISNIRMTLEANNVGKIEEPRKYSFSTWDAIMKYVHNCPYYTFQGINIWTPNGCRFKIRNPRYIYVRELMGNLPITPSLENKKNLFYLFWRLYKNHKMYEFLRLFDQTNNGFYSTLFDGFKKDVYALTNELFEWYQNVNVNHSKTVEQLHSEKKYLVPFCIELHKKYKETKSPIRQRTVVEYIRFQDAGRLYGRIYTPMHSADYVEEPILTEVVIS